MYTGKSSSITTFDASLPILLKSINESVQTRVGYSAQQIVDDPSLISSVFARKYGGFLEQFRNVNQTVKPRYRVNDNVRVRARSDVFKKVCVCDSFSFVS